MVKDRQVDRPVIVPLISWNLHRTDAHGSLQLSSIEKVNQMEGVLPTLRSLWCFFFEPWISFMNPFSFPLLTKVIYWSKSTRMDFSFGTSFSKFSSIFMYLEGVTQNKKSNIWGKKIYFQFFYSPSILYRLIKSPFPETLASQNSLKKQRQWEDDQVPEQQKKKGEGGGRERSI